MIDSSESKEPEFTESQEKAKTEEAQRSHDLAEAGFLQVLRGLLWSEWFAHSKVLLVFLIVWLFCAWLLPLFAHPGWILLVGVAYALLAGPIYGGTDAIEDCEEFTLSLPPTRSDRFLARLLLGGGTVIMFVGLDWIVLGLDWSSTMNQLYITTGIITPTPALKPGLLYGLVLALPMAVFSISFTLSSIVRSRFVIFTSWFWSSLSALALLYGGFSYEELVWDEINGFFSFPLLMIAGITALIVGYRLYLHKEVGNYGSPLSLPQGWWIWLILIIVGATVATVIIASLLHQFPKFLTLPGE